MQGDIESEFIKINKFTKIIYMYFKKWKFKNKSKKKNWKRNTVPEMLVIFWLQGTFSVDVSHHPPSTYTVKDLYSGVFDNEPSRPFSQTRSVALEDPTFFIQRGLRKLCLSATKTSSGLIHAPLESEFNKAGRKFLPHICLVFLKDTETGIISLFSTMDSELTIPFQLRPVCDYELLVIRGYEPKRCLFIINAVAFCSFKSCKLLKLNTIK